MNLNILKNIFVYIFALSVCTICTLQSKKKKTEERKSNYICTDAPLPPPSCKHLCTFGLNPFPPTFAHALWMTRNEKNLYPPTAIFISKVHTSAKKGMAATLDLASISLN